MEHQRIVNMDLLNQFKALESERDRLKAEILSQYCSFDCERTKSLFDLNQEKVSVDVWKSKAEKLAEALKLCITWMVPVMDGLGISPIAESRRLVTYAKEALAEYEKEGAMVLTDIEQAQAGMIKAQKDYIESLLQWADDMLKSYTLLYNRIYRRL